MADSLPTVENCCFSCSLKPATITIGILGCLFLLTEATIAFDGAEFEGILVQVSLITSAIFAIASLLLVIAAIIFLLAAMLVMATAKSGEVAPLANTAPLAAIYELTYSPYSAYPAYSNKNQVYSKENGTLIKIYVYVALVYFVVLFILCFANMWYGLTNQSEYWINFSSGYLISLALLFYFIIVVNSFRMTLE